MLYRSLPALLLLFVLYACGGSDDTVESVPEPRPAEAPVWAVLEQASTSLAGDDFKSALMLLTPEGLQQQWSRDWQRWREQPVDEAFRERFARIMVMLTEEDAERAIAAHLGEQLRLLEAQKAVVLGVVRELLLRAAGVPEEFADQEAALRMLDGLLDWLGRTDLAESQRVERVASLLVAEARASGITRWADVENLEFEAALEQAGRLYGLFREVLLAYDLDLNRALAASRFETLEQSDERAVIDWQLSLFGQAHRIRLPMVRRETGWYLQAVHELAPPEPPRLRSPARESR